jgi:hypothetical protein
LENKRYCFVKKFYHKNDLQKKLISIRGFIKSTAVVIRTKKLINKSRETVPLMLTVTNLQKMYCIAHRWASYFQKVTSID